MMASHLPFLLMLLLCLTPWVSSPMALILGFLCATLGWIPRAFPVSKVTKKLLALSIVGLGFGVSFQEALQVTQQGLGLILTSISVTLFLGFIIARYSQLNRNTAYLITSGTAICGGSAIAAIAPAIQANEDESAIALATVFALNAIALFIFPLIGHSLNLDQTTFGTWAAIAIHDTSSVVGAAGAYGEEALKIATTLKLARALWIIPLALLSAWIFRRQSQRLGIPYFIVFYCIAIGLRDAFPQFELGYHWLFILAKQGLVLSLFFIGCSLSVSRLKQAGSKPLLYGVSLWVSISTGSLLWLLLLR